MWLKAFVQGQVLTDYLPSVTDFVYNYNNYNKYTTS